MLTVEEREVQRMEALKMANAKRTARAELKKKIASGEKRIVMVIADPPEILRTNPGCRPLTVAEVLSWQHRWGKARAERCCRRLGISPNVELTHLSSSRRILLAKHLAGVATG